MLNDLLKGSTGSRRTFGLVTKGTFFAQHNDYWKDGGLSSDPARPARGPVLTRLCRRTGGPGGLEVQPGCRREPVRFCQHQNQFQSQNQNQPAVPVGLYFGPVGTIRSGN